MTDARRSMARERSSSSTPAPLSPTTSKAPGPGTRPPVPRRPWLPSSPGPGAGRDGKRTRRRRGHVSTSSSPHWVPRNRPSGSGFSNRRWPGRHRRDLRAGISARRKSSMLFLHRNRADVHSIGPSNERLRALARREQLCVDPRTQPTRLVNPWPRRTHAAAAWSTWWRPPQRENAVCRRTSTFPANRSAASDTAETWCETRW